MGHRNPDGDALGSTLAMCGVLRQMGKVATVIVPNECPSYLAWLPLVEEVLVYDNDETAVKASLAEAELLMALDFNAFSRLGEMGDQMPNVPCVMIDHHPYPEIDTPLLFSDTSVSSTCEYTTQILYQLGWDKYIDKDIATSLFVGILTDTGRFNHNSSNPETFRMVANLLEKGMDKEAVMARLFDSSREARMRLMGFVLNEKMQLFPEQGLSLITLSMEEKNRFNYQQGDAEGFVNIPLSIDGIYRSVFMQEHDDIIRMSFRSKGDRPVNEIASTHFGGGGHANAAGGSSEESLDDTLAKVKAVFGVE